MASSKIFFLILIFLVQGLITWLAVKTSQIGTPTDMINIMGYVCSLGYVFIDLATNKKDSILYNCWKAKTFYPIGVFFVSIIFIVSTVNVSYYVVDIIMKTSFDYTLF